MDNKQVLTAEERKRLDRQRFIGLEVQKRLTTIKVLITPANGPNIQLAKNLVLSGVSINLFDDKIVDEIDYQTNFLIAKEDIGKKRGPAVFGRLKDMNPTGKSQFFQQNLLLTRDQHKEQFYKNYAFIVTSVNQFAQMAKWDTLTKSLNIPYYNLVSAGKHGFAYISLGKQYQFRDINNQKKKQTTVTIDLLTLKQCLNQQMITKRKQFQFLSALIMMAKAQQEKLKYDPFIENNEKNNNDLNKIVELGKGLLKHSSKDQQFLLQFARTYGLDYCPVYSVIGSIISQQIIKVVQNKSQPAMNWLVYNSSAGYAHVLRLSDQIAKITKHQKNLD